VSDVCVFKVCFSKVSLLPFQCVCVCVFLLGVKDVFVVYKERVSASSSWILQANYMNNVGCGLDYLVRACGGFHVHNLCFSLCSYA
jgi:hypothetical protein